MSGPLLQHPRVGVAGVGYVGLTTAVCVAAGGLQTVAVDVDEERVAKLSGGIPVIDEPQLPALLNDGLSRGRLTFSADYAVFAGCDVVFVCVPTPGTDGGRPDLRAVSSAVNRLGGVLRRGAIVALKSTVPVGTTATMADLLRDNGISVVSTPEFLREGHAVEDLMRPDRIVIGVRSPRPVAALKQVYAPFDAPIIVTDINSAELIKHASNSFLALKISYVNALSVVCEATGANIQEVANGMGMDARIGRRFLQASLGFGGSCFPKDLSAFIKIAEQVGYDFRLLKEVQRINADQMERFVKKITDTLWVLKDKTIGVLGLAFKQNTDDIRMSPALELCHRLQKEGAALRVHDPKAMEKARAVLKDVTFVADMNAVAEGCDALVIATEWEEFKQLDLERVRRSLTHPILFDGRNLFDLAEMERLGFIYKSIGR